VFHVKFELNHDIILTRTVVKGLNMTENETRCEMAHMKVN
jgi:hypothetical protein